MNIIGRQQDISVASIKCRPTSVHQQDLNARNCGTEIDETRHWRFGILNKESEEVILTAGSCRFFFELRRPRLKTWNPLCFRRLGVAP